MRPIQALVFWSAASEAPHRWLPQLPTYYEAPLTQYGRPDFAKRDRWLAKMEREAAIESSNSTATCPRTFKPDPVVQSFVESLPRDPWSLILDVVAKRVNPNSFDTWLKPTRFYGVDGKTLVVRIPQPDFTHITDKWGDLISQAIDELRFPFDAIEMETNG
jgi:DnaA N-terminal domain